MSQTNLPYIGHWPAIVLAVNFTKDELYDVINYLDDLLNRRRYPREEAFRVGMNPKAYDGDWEIRAIRNRVRNAIQKISSEKMCA
jgi:hypothetical protein